MTWYKSGTVSVTNGSASVVGVDTLWATQAAAGDMFTLDGSTFYEVLSVTDNTHLALASTYAEATLSAQAYAIIRNFTSTTNAQLALNLADMINKWHLSLDELLTWLTSLGSVTLTNPATGSAVSVKTPSQIQAEWIGALSKAITTADVALTATEASNAFIKATGALTGNRSMTVPAAQGHLIAFENATSGAYTLTVKTPAGTGVVVGQGERALLFCDGTNVVNAFTSAPGINAADVANTPSGNVTATDMQAAVNELDAEKAKLAGDAAQDFSAKNLTSTGNSTLGDSAADTHTINGAMVFNHGFVIGSQSVKVNNIGTPGAAGFGVGICPSAPDGMYPLSNGTFSPFDDDYGNYIYSDGSIMVWIPAFYYKYGTGANGLAVNVVDVKPLGYFVTAANSPFKSAALYADEVTAANAAGYALHRAFYDGDALKYGVFVDKYKCSNNGGTASSIRNGNPLSSAAANNPFSGLTGAPANAYYGAIAAAKTRGASFFPGSLFIRAALAMLAYAHAQASTSTTWCAWYNATYNFPKGCNNNALGDAQDGALTFTSAGNATYPTANKTGSANVLAKTTHNGQACGVADVNGTIWEVCLGLTSNGTNLYILKTSAAMKDITASNTLATDAWGATGIAALYDDLGTTHGALWATGANRVAYFGAATQVFDAATSGNAWNAAGAGIPLAGGIGGTNAFGNDGLWDYKPNEMCPLVAGSWSDAASVGAWALHLGYVRSNANYSVGLRAALYL